MSFTATIEGIEQLKQDLSGWKLNDNLVKAIGSTVRELHSLLRTRVQATYNTGGRNLNSALVGSTESSLRRGQGFIETGLIYQSPKLPMNTFPIQTLATGAITSFVAPNIFTPLLRGKIKRVKPVEAVLVKIRKDKVTYVRGGFKGKVSGKTRVLRRSNYFQKGRTWDKLPTKDDLEGSRSDYYEMYGIGLADMAEKVYDTDPDVARFKDSFEARVRDKLEL